MKWWLAGLFLRLLPRCHDYGCLALQARDWPQFKQLPMASQHSLDFMVDPPQYAFCHRIVPMPEGADGKDGKWTQGCGTVNVPDV